MTFVGLGVGVELSGSGAPVAGTNEVQTITIGGTPTGGHIKFTRGEVSVLAEWSSTNATLLANVKAALMYLLGCGSSDVTVAAGTLTAGIGTITATFGGNFARLAVDLVTVSAAKLTGTSPTVAIAETTPGVTATGRGCAIGARYTDTANGKVYVITAVTTFSPTWTVVGTQS